MLSFSSQVSAYSAESGCQRFLSLSLPFSKQHLSLEKESLTRRFFSCQLLLFIGLRINFLHLIASKRITRGVNVLKKQQEEHLLHGNAALRNASAD